MGKIWNKLKTPLLRIPVPMPYIDKFIIDNYYPTGNYNPETEEYEYVWMW
jgi:hypothetical protein